MSSLEGARCITRPELFDSVSLSDHHKARELCETCPVFAACEQRLQAELTADRNTPACPTGTWAGKLLGRRDSVRGAA